MSISCCPVFCGLLRHSTRLHQEDDALHSRSLASSLRASHASTFPATRSPVPPHSLGACPGHSIAGASRRPLRHRAPPRREDSLLRRGVDISSSASAGNRLMARRNVRLTKGGASHGARPSKRMAVRARGSRAAKPGQRSVSRERLGGSVAHAAMKRAMRRVALRDCGHRCVYCATQLDHGTATLDHVFPLARGGAHDPGNLVVACAPCNRLKGDLPPYEFFARHAWAGANFVRYARSVHRALKRGARRAVSLAFAREEERAA